MTLYGLERARPGAGSSHHHVGWLWAVSQADCLCLRSGDSRQVSGGQALFAARTGRDVALLVVEGEVQRRGHDAVISPQETETAAVARDAFGTAAGIDYLLRGR